MPLSAANFYVTGGTLGPDAPSYAERQADKDLLASLEQGETCYVLNSRQMGKSSLCVRTIVKLKQAGIRTAFCDLTKFGGRNLTAEQWYAALISEIGRELGMRDAFLAYWKENAALPPVQRLFGAITEPGLQTESPLVVFFDEIDVTLSLPFSADEFFAAIRQCYVGRATDEKLKRLCFCLLGTATPADLIKDTRVSPFNIGKRIEIGDFTAAEAGPLAMGLISRRAAEPQRDSVDRETGRRGDGESEALEKVLYWTGGHPYLTQRLCRAVADALSVPTPNTEHRTPALVDTICTNLFLTHSARDSDDNLAFVRNRLLKSEADLAALLDLYRQLRAGKAVQDDETNPLCALLKLSGVCRVEAGRLTVRNRIYEHVFDRHWVESHMPDAEKRRQREAYRKGLFRAASISAAVMLVISGLAVFGFVSARRAKSEANRARIAEQKANRTADESERSAYFAKMNAIPAAYSRNNFAQINKMLEETGRSKYRGFEWGYWNKIAHKELMTLAGHSDPVWQARFSPNGRMILTVSNDRTARIWATANGRTLTILSGHTDALRSCDWSPDGEHVVTSSEDGTAIVWSATSGRRLFTLRGHRGPVWACIYSPDGRRIATGGDDGTLRIWNAMTGEMVFKQKIASGRVMSLATHPGSSRLASANGSGTWSEWDWTTGRKLSTFSRAISFGSNIVWSRNGKYYVTDYFGAVNVWDARSKHLVSELHVDGSFFATCLSPDNNKLLVGCDDNSVRIYDVKTHALVQEFRGHGNAVTSVAYSPDGGTILSGSQDGTVKLWKPFAGDGALQCGGFGFLSAQFSSDGKRLLLGSTDGRSYELAGAPNWRVTRSYSYDSSARKVYMSAGYVGRQNRMLFGGSRGILRVDDPQSGRVLYRSREKGVSVFGCTTDNAFVLTESAGWHGRDLILWDIGALKSVRFLGATTEVNGAAVSQEGSLVATHVNQRHALIWDGKRGHLISSLEFPSPVYSLLFTKDHSQLLVGCLDGLVRVLDMKTHRTVRTFGPVSSVVRSLALTPDGRRLAAGTDRGDVVFWDFDTGLECLAIKPGNSPILALTVSPDGREAVAAPWVGRTVLLYAAYAGGASQ